MKKLLLITPTLLVGFWSHGLRAQTSEPAPPVGQTQVQKRDRIHEPHAQGQNQAGTKAQKGKKQGDRGKMAGQADQRGRGRR